VASHGWTVRLDAAAGAGSLLTLASGPAGPDPAAQALLQLHDEQAIQTVAPVRISLEKAGIPQSGVTIMHVLDAPLPSGDVAALAYYDNGHSAWTAVPTTVSADRRTVSATVHHLCPWTVLIYNLAASFFSKRRMAPTCETTEPTWISSVTFLQDRNAPVLWCAGRDRQDPKSLDVKVAVNRAYGAAVVPAVLPASVTDSVFHGGPEDIFVGLLARTMISPGMLDGVFGGKLLVPGGGEADFTFTEDQVRSIGDQPLVHVAAEPGYALAGLTYDGLTELAPDPVASAVVIITIVQCWYDLQPSFQAHDWFGAAGTGLDCLEKHRSDVDRDAVTLALKASPGKSPEEIRSAVNKWSEKLWTIWAAQKVFQLLEWLTDQALGPGAWNLTALTTISKAVPVLGAVWASGQEGYGTAHPTVIFNGGDPTGLVTQVHWQSWGGPVALATGVSLDANNAPSVALGVQRPVQIEAFKLGTCRGVLMYQALEWYFPADGQTFDPNNYMDICNGTYVTNGG
jgi:hypothetical protein